MRHIVVGMGEIGTALYQCLMMNGHAPGRVDIESAYASGPSEYLHICIPGTLPEFLDVVAGYIEEYGPRVCIIHSTVNPGTTDALQEMVRRYVAYSPVRGRHGQLVRDMLEFVKYVGAPTIEGAKAAALGLIEAGLTVKVASSATVLELAKLFQTTYTGILVAWAQEMARYCDEVGVDYEESQALNDQPWLPPCWFQPGKIGGHCIMPNLRTLDQIRPGGVFTTAVRVSNDEVVEEPLNGEDRLWPVPFGQNK